MTLDKLICTTCGRHPATDGDEDCLVCRTKMSIYTAQTTGVSRRVAAAIQEGRALGLDDQSLAWAAEDAVKVDAGDAAPDANLFPRASALASEADALRYKAYGDASLDDAQRSALHARADELVIQAGRLVETDDGAAQYDGHTLLSEVLDLMCRRLPRLAADDPQRPVISSFVEELGPRLGRGEATA